MQFLKTLLWVALTAVLLLFAIANWQPVTIELWGGLKADIKLPVLVFAAFLVGFVPTFLLYRARLWSLGRRLEAHERNAASSHTAAAQQPPPSVRPTSVEPRTPVDTISSAP